MSSITFAPTDFLYVSGYKATDEERDIDVLNFTLRSIDSGVNTADKIQAKVFGSSPNARRGSYAGNTLRNMGLADYVKGVYMLNAKGKQYVGSSRKTQDNLVSAIASSIDLVANLKQRTMGQKDVFGTVRSRYMVSDRSASRSTLWYTAIAEQTNDYGISLDRSVQTLNRYTYELSRPKLRLGALCLGCFMTKSLSGICGNCD